MSLRDSFCTFFRVRWFNLKDLVRTIFYFWRKPLFAKVDCALFASYFFQSPYRLVRTWTEGREPYGETPLTTMQIIAKRANITSQDVVYELGSGRGRAAFWLAIWVGCETIGIENVPTFIEKAQKIAKKFQVKNATFCLQDMLTVDFSRATVIYLFGTSLPDASVLQLVQQLRGCKKGTSVITISYSLTEYTKDPHISLIDSVDVPFAWGLTTAFIHKIS